MKLPFRKNKQSQAVRFVVMSDSDGDVQQWSLTRNAVATISVLLIVLCSSLLFFTADFLTDVLYKSRLEEYRIKNQSLTTSVTKLENRLDEMTDDILDIEEKDKALRTYANLPEVDIDVRKLGVGGRTVDGSSSLDDLLPNLESKLSILEIDLDDLARKIRFERKSFATIYDAVRENTEKIKTHQILVDSQEENTYLLQIFTKNLFGPIFIELIQREGDNGFGEGNFQALFDSIERDQMKRGVI